MNRGIVVLIALAVAGCSPQSQTPSGTAGSPSAAAAPSAPAIVGKAPRGAIVTVEPSPPRAFPPPDGPAIMDQYAKQFVPELLFVRVGQPVEFRNSEDSPHNVNVNRMPTGTAVFSTSTAPFQKYVHTFDQPGQYSVACDIHPGMQATVVATTTPYAIVADDNGAFRVDGLEPGSYKVAWIGGGQRGEKVVAVANAPVQVTLP